MPLKFFLDLSKTNCYLTLGTPLQACIDIIRHIPFLLVITELNFANLYHLNEVKEKSQGDRIRETFRFQIAMCLLVKFVNISSALLLILFVPDTFFNNEFIHGNINIAKEEGKGKVFLKQSVEGNT